MESEKRIILLKLQMANITNLKQLSRNNIVLLTWNQITIKMIKEFFGEDHHLVTAFNDIRYAPVCNEWDSSVSKDLFHMTFIKGLNTAREILENAITEIAQDANLSQGQTDFALTALVEEIAANYEISNEVSLRISEIVSECQTEPSLDQKEVYCNKLARLTNQISTDLLKELQKGNILIG